MASTATAIWEAPGQMATRHEVLHILSSMYMRCCEPSEGAHRNPLGELEPQL
jgi:hypothetical protein